MSDSDQASAPQFAAPQFAAPEFAAPEFAAPEFAAPQFAAPQFAAPQFAAPQFAAPEFAAPQFAATERAGEIVGGGQPRKARGHLVRLVERGGVVVLSGAGLSTESGIPDYRGVSGARRSHAPMTFQSFVRDARARHRYWARGYLGWRHFGTVRPNDGHGGVAALEFAGLARGVITQNVDGLHTEAGSREVIDLHGRMSRVVCLDCGERVDRVRVQDRLDAANRGWSPAAHALNPDGDVDLHEEQLDGFTMVDCESCGGVLKPDVVYFGENVPADRVAQSYAMVEAATSLLVLGTSLTVFSGRRFVVRAAQRGIPIAIVNSGPTRCDDLAALRIDAPLGATLRALVRDVGADMPTLQARLATSP